MTDKTPEKLQVLFFARYGCEASERILKKLLGYNYNVTVHYSKERGESISESISSWTGDFIFCFRSFVIIPPKLLAKAKVAAINFHPAPPEYPGSGCINFALYDNVQEYGVTAHFMNAKVDNGKIIEVRRFPVLKKDDLQTLLARTHMELCSICIDFIDGIYLHGLNYIEKKLAISEGENWNGSARKMSELESLKNIKTTIDKYELDRIVRATYIKQYPPKINLHGYDFYLSLND